VLCPEKNTNQVSSAPNYLWTGSSVELVELIYGFAEMKSINNGETPITELANFFGSQFGMEIKDCYSAYVDMKRRKNDSRTYYLDKMRERLNLRMQLDDEREKSRR
jgi:RteC protein